MEEREPMAYPLLKIFSKNSLRKYVVKKYVFHLLMSSIISLYNLRVFEDIYCVKYSFSNFECFQLYLNFMFSDISCKT